MAWLVPPGGRGTRGTELERLEVGHRVLVGVEGPRVSGSPRGLVTCLWDGDTWRARVVGLISAPQSPKRKEALGTLQKCELNFINIILVSCKSVATRNQCARAVVFTS